MNRLSLLQNIIEPTLCKCTEFLKTGDNGLLYFIDPNDNREISAHYGATHAATAFLIYGKEYNQEIYEKGISLFKSILARWNEIVKLPAFHFDFNNFALCIAYDYIEDTHLKNTIKDIVCGTSDSNHDTVNWIPMRWYVNLKRYEWTSNVLFKNRCNICREKIIEATNKDGSVEDRLPKGISFNLQYDISTVATLELLRTQGVDIDLSSQLGFLLKAVLPDGDINYQGRGCNQIFAWGPWIYLLSSSNHIENLSEAQIYLEGERLKKMLINNNMMLNEYPGKTKFLWWDYHYASVYIAHFLLWTVLAFRDFSKYQIKDVTTNVFDSGFDIIKAPNATVSLFDGRSEYLAEKGPCITSIYTIKKGNIFKGTFGPWKGLFGNINTFEDVVIKNFIGLIGLATNNDFSKSRILKRIIKHTRESCKYTPMFLPINIDITDNCISLTWTSGKPINAIFNAPLCTEHINMTLSADGKRENIFCIGTLNNQYGKRYLFQSHAIKASSWTLIINTD